MSSSHLLFRILSSFVPRALLHVALRTFQIVMSAQFLTSIFNMQAYGPRHGQSGGSRLIG